VTSIRHLIRTAQQHGLALDEGPTAGQPAFSSRVTAQHAQQLWERAARELGPQLPLLVAESSGDHLGLMYFAASSCRTVGEAVQLALRHWSYVTGALALQAIRRGDDVHLRFQVMSPLSLGARLGVEYLLVKLARAAQELSGGLARPTGIMLSHRPPIALDAWESALGIPVRVDPQGPALVIAGASLAQPVCAGMSRAAGRLFLELLDWCTPRAQPEPTVAQRVADALRRDLRAAAPTVEQVAVELALSTRSLHRQLAAEGTSYQRLLDGVRRDEAIRQALERRPFKAIAAAVGFADPRAFRRAFKRWTGTTPQEFRLRGLTGFSEPKAATRHGPG
jgi:AraC-like DNA-binding protein